MTLEIKSIIKKLLTKHDLTVAQLSRATGVPKQTITNWLNGQSPRRLDQLKAVADYFSVTVDFLVYGSSSQPPRQIKQKNSFEEYQDEINAGLFEVVLRRIKR